MFKPYLDSPGHYIYGETEDIAFTLYAMDCEGEFDDTININIEGNFSNQDIEKLVKEIERIWN